MYLINSLSFVAGHFESQYTIQEVPERDGKHRMNFENHQGNT